MSISIFGAGSWGSALAVAMSKVEPIILWSKDQSQVEQINTCKTNVKYLPDVIRFSNNVTATSDLDFAAATSELLVIATPCRALRTILMQIKSCCAKKIPDVLWVCKGFEEESRFLPHQIVSEVCPELTNVGALLGPSFAKEVALGLPTAIALSSDNLPFALTWIQRLKKIPNFRIYANDDVIGSEVGAGVKNIMAIAAGIADGLGLGHNARAALITRSLSELSQLVIALGGRSETLYGLTGIGDLILTCTGDLSRNRTVGLELALGHKIDTVLANLGHVAEGVDATKVVYKVSKQLNLDMPIVDTVYRIIYENAPILDSVAMLLQREPKVEF